MTYNTQYFLKKCASARRRIILSGFMRCALTILCPGLVIFATLHLLSKLLYAPLVYTLWGLPLWLLTAILLTWKNRDLWLVSQSAIIAEMDRKTGADGLLMSMTETSNRNWEDQITSPAADLKPVWPRLKMLEFILVTAALVSIGFLPQTHPKLPDQKQFSAITRLEELTQKLESSELAEEKTLKTARELLEDLKKKKSVDLQASDLQALDTLEETLQKEAIVKFRNETELNALAETLTQPYQPQNTESDSSGTGESKPQSFNPATIKQATEALNSLSDKQLMEMSKHTEQLSGKSAAEIRQFLKQQQAVCNSQNGPMQCHQALQTMLETHAKQQSTSQSDKLGVLKKTTAFSPEDLQAILAQTNPAANPQQTQGTSAKQVQLLQPASLAGINKGPGHTALAPNKQNKPTVMNYQGVSFETKGESKRIKLGSQTSAPSSDTQSPDSETTVSSRTSQPIHKARKTATWHTRTLPRHNAVLKKYFETGNE
jgi:hypothetical protein